MFDTLEKSKESAFKINLLSFFPFIIFTLNFLSSFKRFKSKFLKNLNSFEKTIAPFNSLLPSLYSSTLISLSLLSKNK